MGNEGLKGLSVNAKTLIVILLFVNVGFATKMLNKYYKMKETGYVREKTFHEQLEQRVKKAFGSMEELDKVVNDITRQKEDAERVAASFREQDEQLKLVNKRLEETKSKLEEEKARLQKEIWAMEDSLSLAKKENAELKKQLEQQAKMPGEWSIPH